MLINKAITGWFKHAGDRYEMWLGKHNYSDPDEDTVRSPLLFNIWFTYI